MKGSDHHSKRPCSLCLGQRREGREGDESQSGQSGGEGDCANGTGAAERQIFAHQGNTELLGRPTGLAVGLAL